MASRLRRHRRRCRSRCDVTLDGVETRQPIAITSSSATSGLGNLSPGPSMGASLHPEGRVANGRSRPEPIEVEARIRGGGRCRRRLPGYTFGSGFGSTILTEWFSAIVALALASLILIVLLVLAVLMRWKSTNRDPALRSVIRVGALFVAAIGLGWVLSRFFASV
jgi:hypothetical protein